MPILPIIDLLILMAWTSLFAAVGVKAIHVATHYRPLIFGLGALDLVIMATVMLIFALALAARTWVKGFEGEMRHSSRVTSAAMDALNFAQPRQSTLRSDRFEVEEGEQDDEDRSEPRPAASG
jgi:hypothetical protein